MTRSQWLRVGAYIVGLCLIFFVLFISIIRQALYAPTLTEQQLRANISITQRFSELQQWPPTPDHPVYPLLMARDRVRLLLAPLERRVILKIEYANHRLALSKTLKDRSRYTLAITTITKAEKYLLSANEDLTHVSAPELASQRALLMQTIDTHAREITAMKPAFSDEQKAILDRLLMETAIVYERN